MGFNPFRPAHKSTTDVAIVVVFAIVIVGFLVWATFG